MELTLGSLLVNVVLVLVRAYAGQKLQKLLTEPPLTKAIAKTVELFPDIEGLQRTLTAWCCSKDFTTFQSDIVTGMREPAESTIVQSFIDNTEFFNGDRTYEAAREIISSFLANLRRELLSTTETALPILAETLDRHHGSSQLTLDTMSRKLDLVLARREPDDVTDRNVDELNVDARIDVARDLINDGKILSARKYLLALREELESRSPSAKILFRIAANLGACALCVQDYEEASKEFDAALKHQPTSQKALTNQAYVHLLRGSAKAAFSFAQSAFELDPQDRYAAAVYIRALGATGESEMVTATLQSYPALKQDPKVLATLGLMAFDEGHFSDAASYIRGSIENDNTNPHAFDLLGRAILAQIQESYHDEPVVPFLLSEDDQRQLDEAAKAFTSAIEILGNYELKKDLNEVLFNRSVCNAFRGKRERALVDCDAALVNDRDNPRYLAQRGLCLLSLARFADGADGLMKAFDAEPDSRWLPPLLVCLIASRRLNEAAKLLTEHWGQSRTTSEQLQLAELILDADKERLTSVPVEEAVKFVKTHLEDNPRAKSILSKWLWRHNEKDEALRLATEAVNTSSGSMNAVLRIELANLYYEQEAYDRAAQVLDGIVDTSSDSNLARKYLICLYNAGRYGEVLQIAQKIRETGGVTPVITELEASVLELIGDVDGALGLLSALGDVEPWRSDLKVNRAQLLHRKGDSAGTRAAVLAISLVDVKNEPKLLMKLAQLRIWVGLDAPLEYAFRARQKDFNDPNCHLMYVTIFLRASEKGAMNLDPDVVAPDCTVKLTCETGELIYNIVDEISVDRVRNEISSRETLGAKLLGLRIGEKVTVREGTLGEKSYTLTEVKSKYVHAFQETLLHFGEWFPDATQIEGFEARDGGVGRVLKVVDERQAYTESLIKLYSEGKATLGTLAQLMRCPIVKVWGGLTQHPETRLMVSDGNVDELQRQKGLVSRGGPIVIDSVGLFSIGRLDLFEQLGKAFERIIIPQAVVDDLRVTRLELEADQAGSFSIHKGAAGYERVEITEESKKEKILFIDTILQFIHDRCEVIPVRGLLKVHSHSLRDLELLLGRSALAAIVAAKDLGIPLFSDDERLRLLARSEYGTDGVSSWAVLERMRSAEQISSEEYSGGVVALVSLNYFFVPLSALDVAWALEASGGKPSREIRLLFERLHGGQCDQGPAVKLIAEMLKHVWVSRPVSFGKMWLIDVALASLAAGRNPKEAFGQLMGAIHSEFRLVPLQEKEVLESLRVAIKFTYFL